MALSTACQTPEVNYSIHIKPDGVDIKLSNVNLGMLTEEEAIKLEANLHNVLELVLAPYYKSKAVYQPEPWAGKVVSSLDKPIY